ncbi:DUF4139 domain-containing protein [candidate division LCP-89 bacterium B3_LCP]|uniref:DUF4139 domain-containing protein n=1 Tax=candidate division LCP-89 bacterium B3_LCP TaxID=2012998 RepID=A0A532V507_UNCL8|nr:MAG: DUF4139 domain-containing protein [candidate division LCP-89 bacterium B3_LCP]
MMQWLRAINLSNRDANENKNSTRFVMKLITTILAVLITVTCYAQDVSVTVYNQNLGLIKEIRPISVERGAFTFEAADVAAQIDPTSVHLKLDNVSILDQDFEYDLVSRTRLLERYLDQKIEVFTDKGDLFEGKLLSASGSQLILQSKDGQVQIISPDAVRDIRFGELPGGLRTRPTLVWSLIGHKSGKQNAELSYLTHGMTWHAEYVAVISDKTDDLDLSSWVSIENRSGATYKNAKLKLMAGDVKLVHDREQFAEMMTTMDARTQRKAPAFEEKAFYEYHLYTLQRPTTLKDLQTKQISLFDPVTVQAKREYIFEPQKSPKKVMVNLVFENEKKAGLGIPLPAGKVRVYQQDDDNSLEFIGEDRIEHTPKDEEVRIVTGSAFDLTAEKKTTDMKRLTDRVREEAYSISLRNHKDKNVTISVIEKIWGDWEILEKSHQYVKKNATTIEFQVPVAAGKETVITYRVRRK